MDKFIALEFQVLLLFILTIAVIDKAWCCNRVPLGITAAKSPADENYVLSISGNPQTYVPGQKYNVSINAYNGQTFISFMLGLENENGESDNFDALGTLEVFDLTETRFSPRCSNVIENTNTNAKTHIEVTWNAPASTSNGCILLRATVAQHRDVWFMDDGFLTKRICEEEIDDIDSQPTVVDPCCACDEAKYELTFEGKWSRHTHPKDFPANSWRTRFSDIIGASHTIEYRFWQYGVLASDGLREVAEHGSTRTLESELKDQSDKIRTIIKARGIAYPNVTGKTFAVFRVDSKHHLISLVSMIDPSPDWLVGVSGLELCLPNCSWVENKVHNLYPWDAGTDSGPSYMSADQPQVPPDVIRRIKSNFPNDPRSPFYDASGAPMKPLATLHINRRRLYEKICESTDSETEPSECATLPWSRWDECSTKCGTGKRYRTREFKNPAVARQFKCRNSLREEQNCVGRKCGLSKEENAGGGESEAFITTGQENAECAVSEWGDWSSCSQTCGTGVMVRSRHYLNRNARKKCQKVKKINLHEKQKCEGIDCGGEIENTENEAANDNVDGENNMPTQDLDSNNDRYGSLVSYSLYREDYIPPECGVSQWSDFSPCFGECGGIGTRQRERVVWNKNEVYNIKKIDKIAKDPCEHIKRFETVNCTMTYCDAIVPDLCYEDLKVSPCRDSDVANFWFYDHLSNQCALFWADKCDKNKNKFTSKESCEETCKRPRHRFELRMEKSPIDCKVTEWQSYPCNATCGEGVQIKVRKVLTSPKYGGKPCPKHLVRIDKCFQHCDEMYSVGGRSYFSQNPRNTFLQIKHKIEKDECRYSEWSVWSPCTASCGDNSVRQKTRILYNTELTYKCKDRVRIENCTMMPCLLKNNDENER